MSDQNSKPMHPREMKPTVYHYDPSPVSWTCWYADADFEDGSIIFIAYYFGMLRPPGNADDRFIEFSLCDAAGKPHMVRVRFSKDECQADLPP